MKKIISRIPFLLILALSLVFLSCDSWMSGNNFFDTISDEVKYANAPVISVYVRYPNRTMGETSPNGNSKQKVDIPFSITAVDSDAYGFYKWAAFSSTDSKYSTIRQYSYIFESEESYQSTLGKDELGEDVVVFEDLRNFVTTAKVLTERNDVFIMPICVRRPYIASSNPANGAVDVVKNQTVDIVFSKPMDPYFLVKSDGTLNTEYVSIQAFRQVGEVYLPGGDISEYLPEGTSMQAKLSTSKKTLSISMPVTNPPTYWQPQKSFSVTVSYQAKDTLGYEMSKDGEFSFGAGSDLDSISPVVMELEVGTNHLKKHTTEDDLPRVGKTLNVRTVVGDRTKQSDSTATENNVAKIGYRLDKLQSPSNTLNLGSTTGINYIDEYPYASGFVATDEVELSNNQTGSGTTFPIDIKDYDDGLWKLSVWGVDKTGNSGDSVPANNAIVELSTSMASEASTMYIYFVKDTWSPADTNSSSITAQTEEAPYGWYNPTTLSNIKMKESTAGAIVDSPNYNNAYKSKYVWWAFHMGDGADSWASSITPNSTAWHKIDATANPNGESLASLLGVSSINSSSVPEGTVNVSVMFKDDVGNMSSAVSLDSVKYDGTKPVTGALEWNAPSGIPEGFANASKLANQTLKIPFTETLSGVKKISITVDPPSGNAGYMPCKKAFDASDFNAKIKTSSSGYSNLSFTKATNTDNGVQEIVFADPLLSSTTNEMQNYIYLDNLKIADYEASVLEGIYTVKVKLYDTALNEAVEKTVEVFVDKTAPVVNKIVVENAVKYGSGDAARYYLTSDAFSTDFALDKVTLDVTMVEKTSGIYEITLGENASVIAPNQNSGIVGTRVLDSSGQPVSAAYTVDTTTNTIRFTNKSTAPKNDTQFTLKLANVRLTKQNDHATGDKISVTVKDFATLNSNTLKKLQFNGDTAQYDDIYMDYYYNGNSTNTYSFKVKSEDAIVWGYANSTTVDAWVALPYNIEKPGIDRLKFSGVKAVSATTIKLYESENAESGTPLSFTTDNGGLTVKLNSPLTSSDHYHYLKIENMELVDSTTQGSRTLSVYHQFLTGWENNTKTATATVYYDTVAPAVNGELSWVATSSSVTPGIAKTAVISDQYLVIPVTEATSGVNNFKIEVKKEGGTNLSAANSCASVDYVGFDTSDTISTGGSSLVYPSETPVPLWGKDTNKITVVSPTTYGKYKHYYIKGLTISGANPVDEGNYIVSVTMYDQAGNVSTTKTITISNDHTCPVVEDTWFEGVENTALNGSGTYIHPHHRTYTTSSDNNTLYIKMTETGSGIKTIDLQHYTSSDPYSVHNRCRTVIPTSDTKLYVISETNGETHTEEVTGFTYSATSSFRGITLPQTKAIKGSHVLIKITGLKITEGNTTTDNELKDYCAAAVRVVLKDYATNTSTYPSSPAGVTTNNPYAAVVEDRNPVTIKNGAGGLYDSGKVISEGNLVDDSSSITPYTGFTNSPVVSLSCKLNEFAYDAEMTSSSGLRVIKLEGASFIPDSAKNGTKGTYIIWVEYCHSSGRHANFNNLTGSGNVYNEYSYKYQYYIESKDSIADCEFGFEESDKGFYLVGNDTLVFRTPLNVWDNYDVY